MEKPVETGIQGVQEGFSPRPLTQNPQIIIHSLHMLLLRELVLKLKC